MNQKLTIEFVQDSLNIVNTIYNKKKTNIKKNTDKNYVDIEYEIKDVYTWGLNIYFQLLDFPVTNTNNNSEDMVDLYNSAMKIISYRIDLYKIIETLLYSSDIILLLLKIFRKSISIIISKAEPDSKDKNKDLNKEKKFVKDFKVIQ